MALPIPEVAPTTTAVLSFSSAAAMAPPKRKQAIKQSIRRAASDARSGIRLRIRLVSDARNYCHPRARMADIRVSHEIAEKTRESVPLFVNEVFDHAAVNKLIDTFFFEIDSDRSGQLDVGEFQKLMHKIGIQDDLLIERNFKAWDLDSDGSINFQEFITGLSTLHGQEEQRLNMAFKVYDLDGNGKIDRDEMMTVLKRALKYSHPEFGPSEVSAIILDLFRVAGVDPDDELDLDQFKKGVKSKKIVADCFRPTTSLLEVDVRARRESIGKNPLWYKNL